MSGFDKLNNFWDELKKRNVVRALIFYAVTAWLIIQFAATTFPYLNIPKGAITIVIVVLLIGLPIVLIVSWIYEMTTDGLRKTDDVSGEKSITLKTGKKLNRLTTVVLSLAVIFLLVDKFYLGEESSTTIKKTEAIAIFPFSVQGASIQLMKEGMVDLISDKLNHIPGMNATDPNILISAVNSRNVDSRNPEQAGALAKELGANRAILGSLTEVGDQLYLKISKYDNEGIQLGQTISEQGTSGELMSQVDNIIKRLVAEELEEQGSEMNSEAVLTTNKLESIIPFLEGTQLARVGKYEEALAALKESLDADSTFALGYYRYIDVAGWVSSVNEGSRREAEYTPYFNKLEAASIDFKGKTGELLRAKVAYLNSDISSEGIYRSLLTKYGESVEIINGLAESIFHHRDIVAGDRSDAQPYFERLLELDPTNDKYLDHIMDIAERDGDLAAFESYALRLNPESSQQKNLLWRKLMLQDSVNDEEILELSKISNPKFILIADHKTDILRGFDVERRVMEIDDRFAWFDGYIDRYGRRLKGEHDVYFQEKFDLFEKYGGLDQSVFTFLGVSSFEEIPIMSRYAKELIPKGEATLKLVNTMDPNTPKLEIEYILGLLHLFEGNEVEANNYLVGIRSQFDNNVLTEFGKARDQARLLYYNFAGIRDYMSDDYNNAKAHFDSAVTEVKRVNLSYATGLAGPRNLHLAEMHIKNLEYQEALDIYEITMETQAFGIGSAASTWGFNVYRIAQMHDELGNESKAIGYYKKFLEAFQNADEMYMPWVEDAFSRLSVLVGQPEQALRGEIN